jgi:hypothetical protein
MSDFDPDDYSPDKTALRIAELRSHLSEDLLTCAAGMYRGSYFRNFLVYLDLQAARFQDWVNAPLDLLALVVRTLLEFFLPIQQVFKTDETAIQYIDEMYLDHRDILVKLAKTDPIMREVLAGELNRALEYSGPRIAGPRDGFDAYFYKFSSKFIHPTALSIMGREVLHSPERRITFCFFGLNYLGRCFNFLSGKIAAMKDQEMKRDAKLIEFFVKGYADLTGTRQVVKERPDEAERKEPAIDAIAEDEEKRTTAIEHTLVQPFEGQRADDPPFNTVFERIQKDKSLLIPGRLIELWSPAFAIPKGVDWNQVGDKVCEWFRIAAQNFPPDAEFSYAVPDLPFRLVLHVQTMEIPDTPGVVSAGRIMPKDRPFGDVIRKALRGKLPKLVAVRANRHILLLEDASMALGLVQVTRELDSCWDDFPQLKDVDAVWICKTAGWDNSRVVWFLHIWPGGVRERFRINVDTLEVH